MSALDRLKLIQANYKTNWSGINCDYTGRPGTAIMCNKDRSFPVTTQMIEEVERSQLFAVIFDTLRNIEADHPLLLPIAGTDARGARTGQNFYQKQKIEQPNNVTNYHPSYQGQSINKIQAIRPINASQVLTNTPPTMYSGPRSYHIDNCEMLYKLLKGDTKLVRSLLEANSFNFTDSHEWNVLWSSSSCKSFLYEGLNEY